MCLYEWKWGSNFVWIKSIRKGSTLFYDFESVAYFTAQLIQIHNVFSWIKPTRMGRIFLGLCFQDVVNCKHKTDVPIHNIFFLLTLAQGISFSFLPLTLAKFYLRWEETFLKWHLSTKLSEIVFDEIYDICSVCTSVDHIMYYVSNVCPWRLLQYPTIFIKAFFK